MAKKHKKKKSPWVPIIQQNKLTLASLMVICSMFFIFQAYYNPDGVVRKTSGIIAGTGTSFIGDGNFSVIDHNSAPFTQKNLEGKYSLIYFGYTFCPDVCPMGLTLISTAYEELQPKMQQQLQMIFVSVDPNRDTPESLKEYKDNFSENFIALTGTKAQIDELVKKYAVFYEIIDNGDEEYYPVDHSAYIYFVGPDGRYIKHFGHLSTVDEIVGELKQYLIK